MQTVALVVFGYLSGSIPFGFLISKLKGTDIRKVGSGNIGGTNVGRAFGFKWGLLVGLMDVLKAFIPAYTAAQMFSDPWQRVAVFISPVIGHIFSVWLGFKGGKGVACVLGTLLAMFSWQQILLAILIWGVALKAVKIMSLVNMILVSLLPPVLWYMYRHPAYLVYGIGVLTIILYAHRSNISRLLKGTELKLPI